MVRGNTKLAQEEAEDNFFPSPSQTVFERKCFKTSPDCYSPYSTSQVRVKQAGKSHAGREIIGYPTLTAPALMLSTTIQFELSL